MVVNTAVMLTRRRTRGLCVAQSSRVYAEAMCTSIGPALAALRDWQNRQMAIFIIGKSKCSICDEVLAPDQMQIPLAHLVLTKRPKAK